MAASPQEEPTSGLAGYFTVNGLPFNPVFNKETIEDVFNFSPKDGDVIIATYPKTGTTWMQYIVLQILSKGESFPNLNDVMTKLVPFIELAGVAAVEALTTKPRVYKHHMPYNVMKKNPNTKIIYVYRKPEDTFVSYFHFMKSFADFTFEEFFERFIDGTVTYGSYFDHLLSFIEHKDDTNILMVSYEKLQLHREEEFLRIAKFLGEEYYNEIANNADVMKKIVEQTSFDYMKKNLSFTAPLKPGQDQSSKTAQPEKDSSPQISTSEKDQSSEKAPTAPKNVVMFRKGVIGDGKKSLTEEQLQRIKKLAEEKMKGTFIFEEWNEAESSL